jgi:hypothetical protein
VSGEALVIASAEPLSAHAQLDRPAGAGVMVMMVMVLHGAEHSVKA